MGLLGKKVSKKDLQYSGGNNKSLVIDEEHDDHEGHDHHDHHGHAHYRSIEPSAQDAVNELFPVMSVFLSDPADLKLCNGPIRPVFLVYHLRITEPTEPPRKRIKT